MTIAVIVANTSRATTRASSAASDGKESANKSGDYWSAGNKALVIPNSETKKRNLFLDAFAFTSFLELDV